MTNAKCPVCGAINMYLNLEETDGHYICLECGSEIQIMESWGELEANHECRDGKRLDDIVATAEKWLSDIEIQKVR